MDKLRVESVRLFTVFTWPVLLTTLLLLGPWLSTIAYAQNNLVLTIATDDGPPHMIKAENSGIDIDITRAVLESIGYQAEIIYMPLSRAKLEVLGGNIDITVPTFQTDDQTGFYLSQPVITYKPTIFTTQQLTLNSLKDIQGLTVFTFQGATGYFGEDFIKMSAQNRYFEMSRMDNLPALLIMNRTDVVVLDYYIFHFYRESLPSKLASTPVYEYSLIPTANASAGFNDKNLRDQFNQALAQFKQQRKIQPIIEKYIGK